MTVMDPATLDMEELCRLTDLAEVPRLLQAAIERERDIEAELEVMLSKRQSMKLQMVELSNTTAEALQDLAIEAEALEASTAGSAELARRVSAAVRGLDARQARVRGALSHVRGLLGRAAAVEGLTAALAREDYDAAATAVDGYLSLEAVHGAALRRQSDAGVGAGAGPPPAGLSREQAEAFADGRATLERVARERLTAAVAARDHEGVRRWAALHVPLRREQAGLELLVGYLSELVDERAAVEHDALASAGGAGPDYLGALTLLFRDVAAAVDEHLDLLLESFGAARAAAAVLALHARADAHGCRVLARYAEHRRLARLAGQVAGHRAGSGPAGGPSPVEPRVVEGVVEELLAVCARCEQYLQYVLLRLSDVAAAASVDGAGSRSGESAVAPGGRTGDGPPTSGALTRDNASSSDPGSDQAGVGAEIGAAALRSSPAAREASLRSGAFASALRELLSHYVVLEEFYVEESVAKALAISAPAPGALVSSAVDDVFYVLARAGGRALATGRAPTAVAVLNVVHGALVARFRAALEGGLVGAAPRLLGAAPAPGEDDAYDEPRGGVLAVGGDWEGGREPGSPRGAVAQAAALPFNDAEVAAGHAATLRARLDAAAGQHFATAQDRDRVRSVLADLGKAAADLHALAEAGAAALAAAVLAALSPALNGLAGVDFEGGETGAPAAASWAPALASELETQLAWLRPLLAPAVHEAVLGRVLDGVLARLEAVVRGRRFGQLAGLALERDLRLLSSRASELAQRSVRDRFARLGAISLLLGLETPGEVADLWAEPGGGLSLRLSETEVRAVLAQRRDWAPSELQQLSLG